MTKLCAAWCGTGKTFLCNQTKVSAIEIGYWEYKDGRQKEYLNDVKEQIGKVDYILLSTEPEGLEILKEEGFDITLVYPENELRNEYLDRYIDRDSPYEFIGTFMKHWDIWLNELKDLNYCKHIILRNGEYLQDVI